MNKRQREEEPPPAHKKSKKSKKEKKGKKKKSHKSHKSNKSKKEQGERTPSKKIIQNTNLDVSSGGGGGIDDIFGALQTNKEAREKKRKVEAKRAERRARVEAEERVKLQPRRDADSGFNVYTEQQLSILNGSSKNGGNTELCPFDCNCCF